MHKVLLGERKERKLTQAEIARNLGMSKEYYARRERGSQQFDLDEAKTIAEYLGMTIPTLFPEFFS